MQVDNLLTFKNLLRAFLDRKINIEAVNMLDVKLGHGYFNKRLQHLYENLHIQFQNQDVVPKALRGLDNVAWKVENG